MSDYGSDFSRCETCGRWMVNSQPHSCEPDPSEICNAIDIDNCAEHGNQESK